MKESRNLNSKESFRIKFKRYKMHLRYYSRYFRKKIIFSWSLILFAISLVLFFSILIPNFFTHRLPIFREWPKVFELYGSVLMERKDTNSSSFIGVTGATIEIGGYKSMTDQAGRFNIKFVSKSSTDVPVIIQWANNTVIKRVSFEANQFEKTKDLILNEK